MLMSDLILKKRDGGILSAEEINWMIRGYTNGDIPDYQMSAMCMAIYFKGMNDKETQDLTMAMTRSGGSLDLSAVSGVKADKHSTGGVGDKTSLVLCPMIACCGVKMAKMSGRGLGHTGGTIDKLESFPGFTTALSMEMFLHTVNTVGFAIAGQTADLCPADKKLYALRDVTGTVASRPLIVGSIMSKKLAAGADVIALDVKTGSGAFMHSEEEAFALARQMVNVGRSAGKKVVAVVTDMDEPLGRTVGNVLEVKEAIAALQGEGPEDLMELCLALGGQILEAGGLAENEKTARAMLQKTISSGTALQKFAAFVKAQGGDERAVYEPSTLPQAPVVVDVPSDERGYVVRMNAEGAGLVSLHLGGGRATKDAVVDLAVGLILHKKVGDAVEMGESLAQVHARTPEAAQTAVRMLRDCYTIGARKPKTEPFIKGIVK